MSTLRSGLLERTDETRAWSIELNGRPLEDLNCGRPARSLVIVCARDPKNPDATLLGRLEYGSEPTPDGVAGKYDTWIFYELGGAVTLPFAFISAKLYVGVVRQRRFVERNEIYNPSGMVRNAPRGFHNIGKSAAQTAASELVEEVGVFEGETFRLNGEPLNANNAWFAYTNELENGLPVGQGGVIPFAVEVKSDFLDKDADGNYTIKPEKLGERPKGSPYEMIGNCTFIPWKKAVRLRDGFTPSAVARLIADLSDRGVAVY